MEINVTVVCLFGQKAQFKVRTTDAVADLKQQIDTLWNVHPDIQLLHVYSRNLEDQDTIEESKLCDGTCIGVFCPNPDFMKPGAFEPHILAKSDEELQALADRWSDKAYFNALPASEASNAYLDSSQAKRYLAYKAEQNQASSLAAATGKRAEEAAGHCDQRNKIAERQEQEARARAGSDASAGGCRRGGVRLEKDGMVGT